MIKRVFQEIGKLKTNGPTEKQVTDEKEALLREFETNSQQNNFLLNQIIQGYQYGEDAAGIWSTTEYYKKIGAAMIQQAAKTYLNSNNYVKVTLLPEKK